MTSRGLILQLCIPRLSGMTLFPSLVYLFLCLFCFPWILVSFSMELTSFHLLAYGCVQATVSARRLNPLRAEEIWYFILTFIFCVCVSVCMHACMCRSTLCVYSCMCGHQRTTPGAELQIPLSLPPKYWDYRHVPPELLRTVLDWTCDFMHTG